MSYLLQVLLPICCFVIVAQALYIGTPGGSNTRYYDPYWCYRQRMRSIIYQQPPRPTFYQGGCAPSGYGGGGYYGGGYFGSGGYYTGGTGGSGYYAPRGLGQGVQQVEVQGAPPPVQSAGGPEFGTMEAAGSPASGPVNTILPYPFPGGQGQQDQMTTMPYPYTQGSQMQIQPYPGGGGDIGGQFQVQPQYSYPGGGGQGQFGGDQFGGFGGGASILPYPGGDQYGGGGASILPYPGGDQYGQYGGGAGANTRPYLGGQQQQYPQYQPQG